MAQDEAARTRMVHSVDERRNPRTAPTLNQLLDRYLEMIDVSASIHVMYQRYLDNHVRPFIGTKKAVVLGPDELDSLYAELRRGPRDRLGREPDGPTFLDVGSAEVFRDEITAFASGLWAAGGQAELHVRPGGAAASTSSPPRGALPTGQDGGSRGGGSP